MPTYLPERQTEYWTSREIEQFFQSVGYSILTIPLSQAVEHHLPADFLYVVQPTLKIFGLQYKALYHNAYDHWNLSQDQHNALQRFPWMYYCMSELRHLREAIWALHYARFYRPSFVFRSPLRLGHPPFNPAFRRWGSFVQAFMDCRVGRKISTQQDLENIIGQCREIQQVRAFIEEFVDVFFVDLQTRAILHAPFSRTLQ